MYKSGFIDLTTEKFYQNIGGGHPSNAHEIIDDNPKLKELFEKEEIYINFEDFLIFKANFAKVGNCGKSCIIIKATSMFKKKLKSCMRKYELMDYEILEWMH